MKLEEVIEKRIVIPGDVPSNQYYAFDEIFKKINKTKYSKNTIFDIDGNIDFSSIDSAYAEMPVKFGIVKGMFDCSGHKLKNLDNFPEYIESGMIANRNNITSLVGIHKIIKHAKWVSFADNPIEEGGIGVLLIDGLKKIAYNINIKSDFNRACEIINKYTYKGKSAILECQEELIEAGLEAFAKI